MGDSESVFWGAMALCDDGGETKGCGFDCLIDDFESRQVS